VLPSGLLLQKKVSNYTVSDQADMACILMLDGKLLFLCGSINYELYFG
jgi:hypothetical protein